MAIYNSKKNSISQMIAYRPDSDLQAELIERLLLWVNQLFKRIDNTLWVSE